MRRNIRAFITSDFSKISVSQKEFANINILYSHNRKFLEICGRVFCFDQKVVTQFSKPW